LDRFDHRLPLNGANVSYLGGMAPGTSRDQRLSR
jgi:hypothetical protein